MAASITPADLTAAYQAWTGPWAGDPFSEADCADRGHQTRQLAAAILAAPVGTHIGPMTKNHGGWDADAGRRADATADPGSDEWRAALGAHTTATLTGDGRGARRDMFCRCNTPVTRWVRYEAYSAAGQEAHGFICPDCRGITQAG
jgi:hypothetical protein